MLRIYTEDMPTTQTPAETRPLATVTEQSIATHVAAWCSARGLDSEAGTSADLRDALLRAAQCAGRDSHLDAESWLDEAHEIECEIGGAGHATWQVAHPLGYTRATGQYLEMTQAGRMRERGLA